MATSNTMNFGPEWMRRFPKTPTSDNNRSTSPTLSSSNATTNSSTISASTNSNINPTSNTNGGTSTFSWSTVAAANSNNITSSRSLHSEASEKSDVPGASDSALNPFKYSKEFMLKLYKPVGLPLEFERHEYVTSEEPLQPMATIVLTEQEQKLLSGASVNSELTRRIVSNASGGTVTGGERAERERVPFSPRGEKHISTGLTSPRSERFGGIIGGVLSGRTSPRSSRPPRTSGSLNLSSVDDPVWNGVTRHAVGTFDSNGVFRIPGSNVEDETLDKIKKEDIERCKKIEQEFEKKNPTDLSDANTYNKSSQNDNVASKSERKEMNNESMNEIEDFTRNELMGDLQESNTSVQLGLQQEIQHERQIKENKVLQDWQESQSQSNHEIDELSLQQDQTDFYQEEQREERQLLQQKPNYRKDDEKDLEHEIEDDHRLELEREKDQLILEQRRQLQLQQKKEQEHHQLQMQRQGNEQKQLQLHLQLQLQQQQQQQHQQQQLLLQQQQQQILQDQQHRQHQQQLLHHHQQLNLLPHFQDQDDDVLKEAFAYSNVGGNTPPLSPSKTNKYTSAHSIIGTNNAFGDGNSGATSLFSGTGIKVTSEQCKWLYRDPSGNIQGPFSSQEMNEWYKGGFFVHSLLVRRVEDTTFEPLGALIQKTGDDERPFSAQIPGSRPSLTISMPNSSRFVNDPFQRPWAGPNSPSTAQLFSDHQQRFNPFGGTASVPNTPLFGVFGRNDASSGGWGDLNSTNSTWGQTESFTSNNENLSPRIQAPNSPPLFNNNSATFNVSPPQSYLDRQRALSQIERQQYIMLQQRQLQQNQHSYPDTFIRQQHQSYGMSGPVSAPISNPPTSPFIDLTRSTGWPATTSTEQPTPSSPWGVLAPGIGVTPSRAPQSDEIGYFGSRKDGLQQSPHIDKISSRHVEKQYEVVGGNTQDSSLDSEVNEVVKSMTKPILVDDKLHSEKVGEKVISEEKIESSTKNIADETSSHSPQKEESYRTKPSLREIQAEEERRKKQQHEKEKLTSAAQQTSNQHQPVKALQSQKINNTAWGNNSSVTPSSPAPWAKDEDHTAHKTPSLREIQEMEARKAAERKAASTVTTHIINKEESTPSNSSWGVIGQNSSNTSNSSSLSTSPVVTTPAWQSNNSAPKKTLREIQKEEEEAMKKRNKIRELQQQSLLGANASTGAVVTNSIGKRYSDTVATGSGSLGTKKIGSTPMNTAWTTVAGKSKITAVSPQNNIGTSVNILSTKPSGKDSTIVWDMDSHKGINGSRLQTQSSKPSEHLKSNNRPTTSVNLGLSKNSGNSGVINANNSSEHSTPRSPSEEFLKWCRQALRGLNDVNVEDFIQMLLTFPLDPPPATIEIIQESVYANSPTLDGRRFADEFIKRRKADANGLPFNSLLNTSSEGKSSKEAGTGNSNTKDDHSVGNAGAFKVVTAKKSKKKH